MALMKSSEAEAWVWWVTFSMAKNQDFNGCSSVGYCGSSLDALGTTA
jgi:hypothetical protein